VKNSIEKIQLSGSTDGKPIQVTGTDGAGAVTVHTASSDAGVIDEVWVYANNTNVSDTNSKLVLFTDTDNEANQIVMGIPYRRGLVYALPGIPYSGGVVLKAYAGIADVVKLHGWVNRIRVA